MQRWLMSDPQSAPLEPRGASFRATSYNYPGLVGKAPGFVLLPARRPSQPELALILPELKAKPLGLAIAIHGLAS